MNICDFIRNIFAIKQIGEQVIDTVNQSASAASVFSSKNESIKTNEDNKDSVISLKNPKEIFEIIQRSNTLDYFFYKIKFRDILNCAIKMQDDGVKKFSSENGFLYYYIFLGEKSYEQIAEDPEFSCITANLHSSEISRFGWCFFLDLKIMPTSQHHSPIIVGINNENTLEVRLIN